MNAAPDPTTPAPGAPRWRRLLAALSGRAHHLTPTGVPTGGPSRRAVSTPPPASDHDSEDSGDDGVGPALGPGCAVAAVGARVLSTSSGVVAVLVVTGYPAEVGPGWLDPLLGYPGRLDVSLHICPVEPTRAAQRLKRQLARLEAGRRHNATHGQLPDPLVEAATEDAHELAARLARGEGKLFKVGLYLAVHAPDLEALADEVAAVRALASSLLLQVRPASYRQFEGWVSCQPVGIDRLVVARTMDTEPLAAAFPLTSPDLPAPDPVTPAAPAGVLVGLNLGSQGLVCHDRFSADNYNAVVLGWSGGGKSFHTKLELLRYLFRGVRGLIVDPEDEYTRLTHAVGGAVIRLGAAGVRLNPLDLPIHIGPDRRRQAPTDAVTRRALFLHTFVTVLLGAELPTTTRAVLDQAVTATYRRAGIDPANPASWTRPAPLLAELAAELASHPDPAGPELATRLHPYTAGSYRGLFDGPTTTPASGHHLVSYSLRELPEELRPIGTLLALDHIWREVDNPADHRPRMVVIDEGWMHMSAPTAARWLLRAAKSFRKRRVALTFVSQDIADVLDSELGQAVITNASMHVLLRQAAQTIDQVARVFTLSAGEAGFLLRARRGEALVITGTHRVAARIVASPAEAALVTTDPAELAALADTDTGYIDLPDTAHPAGAGGSS